MALATLALVGAACAAGGGGSESEPAVGRSGGSGALVSSLEVEVGADRVDLTLHVTNPTSAPVTLHFASGQRYDFEIREPGGESVWRWSASRSFMQALGEEVVGAGETLTYRESWTPGDRSGVFVARGELVSRGGGVAQETEFRIPS